jgi:hypothetical protein
MTRKSLLFAAALLAGGAAALPASAATVDQTSPRGAAIFWLLDRNGDGVIDRSELDALRAVVFDALDTNHDGRLTKDEVAAAASQARERAADRLAALIKAGPAKIAERRAQAMSAMGLDNPDGIGRADFLAREPRLLSKADSDGNGSLSRSEFDAASVTMKGMIAPQ